MHRSQAGACKIGCACTCPEGPPFLPCAALIARFCSGTCLPMSQRMQLCPPTCIHLLRDILA